MVSLALGKMAWALSLMASRAGSANHWLPVILPSDTLSTFTSVAAIGWPVRSCTCGAPNGELQVMTPDVHVPPGMRRCRPSAMGTTVPENSATGTVVALQASTRTPAVLPWAVYAEVVACPVNVPSHATTSDSLAARAPSPVRPLSDVRVKCQLNGPSHGPGARLDVQPATGVGITPGAGGWLCPY